jgi:TPR repeat protein
MKKQLSNLIAAVHYSLGAFLFYSGFARIHRRLHEFSMRELQRSADLGWTKAQVLFGQLLKYRGATDFNKIAGIRYLRESAAKGSADAQFMLAEAIQDKSLIELTSSAEQGSNQLLDLDDPLMLYLSAAKSGHAMAALRLSKIYQQGSCQQKIDTEQAEYWRSEFLKQGSQK